MNDPGSLGSDTRIGSDTPLYPLEEKLANAWAPRQWQDVAVLVAVSGGADSMALLRALKRTHIGLPGSLTVAHFNHQLRGKESEADQQLVMDQCKLLEITCHVGQPQGPPLGVPGHGSEAAARRARYAFLQRTAEQLAARYVVTAHTADDQAETILHHILRGTGLAGLAGMRRTRPLGPAATLMRPMLSITRHEVLAYLDALGQPFREDASNGDRQFTRNRIRHELLPALERDYAPNVVRSLLRLGAVGAEAQRLIDSLADELIGRSTTRCDACCVVLDCRALAEQNRHLVREAFAILWRRQAWPRQAMGFVQWNRLADMALAPDAASEAAGSKHVFPGAISATRRGGQLVLQRPADAAKCE